MVMVARVIPERSRDRGCLSKVTYLTLDEAQEALLRAVERIRSGQVRDSRERPMNVYWCGTCAYWHIGHRPRRV